MATVDVDVDVDTHESAAADPMRRRGRETNQGKVFQARFPIKKDMLMFNSQVFGCCSSSSKRDDVLGEAWVGSAVGGLTLRTWNSDP
jgi:hypothetical protein